MRRCPELQKRLLAFTEMEVYPKEHRFRAVVEAKRQARDAWVQTTANPTGVQWRRKLSALRDANP